MAKNQSVHWRSGQNQTSPPACNHSMPQHTRRWRKTDNRAEVTCKKCLRIIEATITRRPTPQPIAENWEVAVGGNFLEVWQVGKFEDATYLGYDDGGVCSMKLPGLWSDNGMHYDEAIAKVMPRAELIAKAPRMFRFCVELLNEMRAYIGEEEHDPASPNAWAFKELHEITNDKGE